MVFELFAGRLPLAVLCYAEPFLVPVSVRSVIRVLERRQSEEAFRWLEKYNPRILRRVLVALGNDNLLARRVCREMVRNAEEVRGIFRAFFLENVGRLRQSALVAIAECGRLTLLQTHLGDQDTSLLPDVVEAAVRCGHVDVLQFLVEQCGGARYVVMDDVLVAARKGRVNMLLWVMNTIGRHWQWTCPPPMVA